MIKLSSAEYDEPKKPKKQKRIQLPGFRTKAEGNGPRHTKPKRKP
jgi:hypothetical protein